ncbi:MULTISPECIES: hypothetical protein [unclassified Roseibium]|uniref:hypothetical protein n=1 Tax=unclassified Roseibium TaxID=2629323 RepID=UPI00273F6662|nr:MULTISPECIES: hypothetical protein [unclassified Roseibium]
MTDEIDVTSVAQIVVKGDKMSLSCMTADGKSALINLPPEVDKQIISLMADALRKRREKNFDQTAGALLADTELQPLRLEKSLEGLEIQEKFVLEMSAENSTGVTFRLNPESLRRWIDTAEVQMAEQNKKKRKKLF